MITDASIALVDHLRLINGLLEKLLGRLAETSGLAPDDALAVHTEAKLMRGHTGDIGKEADRHLIAALDGQRRAVIGERVVEVRRSYRRTWDTPLLAHAVAGCVLAGERLPEVDTVVAALVDTARLEWRVTALEKLGIETDRYCDKELGAPTVAVI